MLVDKMLDMNIYELRYFSMMSKEKVMKTSGINPMKINLDWPSVKQTGNFSININSIQLKEHGHLLTPTGLSNKN